MKSSPDHRRFSETECRSGTGEDTLRLIAKVPVPEGLADRVHAGLRAAPEPGRLLLFEGLFRPLGGFARGVAAAAIVGVVAGGGWTIYSRVQPAPTAKIIAVPAGVTPGSGFSQAGARRVPQTLQGPVLTHPVEGTAEENIISKTPVPNRTVHKRKNAASPIVAPVQ